MVWTWLLLAFLGLGVVAGGVALLYHALRGRRDPVRWPREPVCGSCGHPVNGLQELECSECGEDLREVGISTPRLMRPGPARVWVLVIANSVLFAAGCFVAGSVINWALGSKHYHSSGTVSPRVASEANWVNVEFVAEGQSHRGFSFDPVPAQQASVALRMNDGRNALFNAERSGAGWRAQIGEGRSVDEPMLADWLKGARVDLTSEAGQNIAKALLAQFDTAARDVRMVGGVGGFAGLRIYGSTWSSEYGPDWQGPGLVLVWLVASGVGAWLITRGSRNAETRDYLSQDRPYADRAW